MLKLKCNHDFAASKCKLATSIKRDGQQCNVLYPEVFAAASAARCAATLVATSNRPIFRVNEVTCTVFARASKCMAGSLVQVLVMLMARA